MGSHPVLETESTPQTESIPAALPARRDSAAHSALRGVSAALRLCSFLSQRNCLSAGWPGAAYQDSLFLVIGSECALSHVCGVACRRGRLARANQSRRGDD